MTHALVHLDQTGGITLGELQRSLEIIIVAATDTTATVLIGAVYHLCRYPAVYAKLKAEVRSAFASEAAIDIEGVSKLPYLIAVIKESMRIHPPVPGNHPRRVGAGGAVVAGNYVPAGTNVSFPHWAAYHSERNWNRPGESFRICSFSIASPVKHILAELPSHVCSESMLASDSLRFISPVVI